MAVFPAASLIVLEIVRAELDANRVVVDCIRMEDIAHSPDYGRLWVKITSSQGIFQLRIYPFLLKSGLDTQHKQRDPMTENEIQDEFQEEDWRRIEVALFEKVDWLHGEGDPKAPEYRETLEKVEQYISGSEKCNE